MSGKLTIGLHLTAGHEKSRREIEGVLRYTTENPDLRLADFCYPGDDPDLSSPPPWNGKVDGVVICVRRLSGIVSWLRRGGVPMVALGADLRRDLISVYSNPRSVARLSVAHYLELGYRNFAYVGYRHADGSRERSQALRATLAKRGLTLSSYETDVPLSGSYGDLASLNSGEPGLCDMIRSAEKPLAIVAINDRFAAAVCQIVKELDLSIPDDVAVMGVQDFEIARIASPPISSIRPATEQTGYEAARLLHRLICGQLPPRRVLLVGGMQLMERESTIGKRRAATTDIDRALAFIRQKACEDIRVEHVAAHVGMPLRTFEIEFSAATGRTVGADIRDVRLERAKTLLATTDLPLARVAHLIGMNTGSYLSEFFRRWMGVTPSEYRRQKR
jgi:LacI family transcriptional regulator